MGTEGESPAQSGNRAARAPRAVVVPVGVTITALSAIGVLLWFQGNRSWARAISEVSDVLSIAIPLAVVLAVRKGMAAQVFEGWVGVLGFPLPLAAISFLKFLTLSEATEFLKWVYLPLSGIFLALAVCFLVIAARRRR
jgi:hypothetical protein